MLRFLASTALAVSAFNSSISLAVAADLDGGYLRGDLGAETSSGWDGMYVGAQVGMTTFNGVAAGGAQADTRDAMRGLTSFYTNAPDLVDGIAGSTGKLAYGAVIGQNWTWDGVVMGIEAGYNRTDLTVSGDEQTAQIYGSGGGGATPQQNFRARYGGKTNITDIATLKARVGYDAGPLMPFIGAGVAVVRGSTSRYLYLAFGDSPNGGPVPTYPGTPQYSATRNNVLGLGMVGSVGLDYKLTEGLFVRGEYEYIRVGNFDGSIQDFQTFKTTLAAKF